jgi:hypothetical protein
MTLLHALYKWYFTARYVKLMDRLHAANQKQFRLLKDLLQQNKNTVIGRRYCFDTIEHYDAFKRQVPVRGYEAIQEEIQDSMRGVQGFFWHDPINQFGKSSGTTDRSKFIPLTREALLKNHYRGGRDMITLYLHDRQKTWIFDGKNLVLNGSFDQMKCPRIGDISAHIIFNLPFWIRKFRIPSLTKALEKEWKIKINYLVEEAINNKVVALTGVPSWMMLVLQKVNEHPNYTKEQWKDLEVFFHGGIHFQPLQNAFEEILGKRINYCQLYNATEGFFAIQEKAGEDDMLLLTHHGIFYEFAPMENQLPMYQKAVSIEEVKKGLRYELIITTNAGLWRYALGDIVEVTQVCPLKLKVIGRTKQYINLFGEELMVHNAEQAIAEAAIASGVHIINYTVAPKLLEQGTGLHEWWIEFESPPKDLSLFAKTLDNALRRVNSDYDAKRSGDLLLKQQAIVSVPNNTFYRWLELNRKLGGQNKVTRLQNDRKLVQTLATLLEANGE